MANYFPRWTNLVPIQIAICVGAVMVGLVAAFSYYGTPKTQRVGYMPDQPIPYDHELHVNQLGIDCRYCHSYVDKAGQANIPTGNVCWGCHSQVQKESPKLIPLRRAVDKDFAGYTGEPVKWVRVHESPDYVNFDHSAHVNRGISCKSCHGKVNEMRVVYQAENHSMGFCLECHNAPEKHLRPLEEVYNLDYTAKDYLAKHHAQLDVKDYNSDWSEAEAQLALGNLLKTKWNVKPQASCTTCHQ